MVNKVTLIGRVGKEPEIRFAGEKKIAGFSLATNEKGKEKTTWHNVKCWEKLADIVEQYVKKGDLIAVFGRIDYQEYEKDGIKRYLTNIVANELKMLGSRNSGGAGGEIPKPPTKGTVKPETPQNSDDLGDDDIPF